MEKRKALFVLVPLLILSALVFLEAFQRVRYYSLTKNKDWLLYGLRIPRQVINLKDSGRHFFRKPFFIFAGNKGRNILFIGGSSVYGVYNDDLHTFPHLLEAGLNHTSCLNAGKPGVLSSEYTDIIRECYRRYCVPDMVVFYTGYNDIFRSFPVRNKAYWKWIGVMERYSFFLLTLRQKLIISEQIKMRRDPRYRWQFVHELSGNIERCINFIRSNRAAKIVIIPEVLAAGKFSLSPMHDYGWYAEIYSGVPEALRELAAAENCCFLDPRGELLSEWKDNFSDPVHLTDRGNEVLAKFLAKKLPLE